MEINPQRKIKNFIVDPRFQLKIVLYFTILSFALSGVLGALIFNRFNKLSESLATLYGASGTLTNELSAVSNDLFLIVLATFFCFSVFIFIYTVIITHRISGPVVAIRRYIDDIITGNLKGGDRNLRSYDELQPIMDKLNELAKSRKK